MKVDQQPKQAQAGNYTTMTGNQTTTANDSMEEQAVPMDVEALNGCRELIHGKWGIVVYRMQPVTSSMIVVTMEKEIEGYLQPIMEPAIFYNSGKKTCMVEISFTTKKEATEYLNHSTKVGRLSIAADLHG